jgi:hypothetical protein
MTVSTRVQVLAFVGASLLPLATPLAAHALAINISGIDYEVSFVSASYNADPDLFGAAPLGRMPWWGNAGLASAFAAEVYNQLGENVYQASYGPVFAYGYSLAGSGEVYGVVQNTLDINDQLDLGSTSPLEAGATYSYAYATGDTAVPAPIPLLGTVAAFARAKRLRRNRKLMRVVVPCVSQ